MPFWSPHNNKKIFKLFVVYIYGTFYWSSATSESPTYYIKLTPFKSYTFNQNSRRDIIECWLFWYTFFCGFHYDFAYRNARIILWTTRFVILSLWVMLFWSNKSNIQRNICKLCQISEFSFWKYLTILSVCNGKQYRKHGKMHWFDWYTKKET